MYVAAHRVTTKVTTVDRRPTVSPKWGSVMKLTREQSQKLLRERGIWVTEACDKCRKLLGSVRWTRRGEPGEWCSSLCRDGSPEIRRPNSKTCRECGGSLTGKRADSEFCDEAHSKRYRRREQSKTAQNREIIPDTPIGKQGLTGAQNSGSTTTLIQPPQALEAASRIEFLSACPPARS
jgi:hypothetical protein